MAGDTFKVILDDEEPQRGANATQATRRVELPDGNQQATRRVEDESSVHSALTLGVLEPGARVCEDYIVERTLFPHESQRPGLYLCSSPRGQVIVKVYASKFPPKPELWNRLPYLHHEHILCIYKTLEEGGHFCEIQEYCLGGTLEARVPKPGMNRPPVSATWISDVLLPQISQALVYLHSQEIIHRDIKPANIYIKDVTTETLVLADFDISSVLEQTHTSRDTQRAGGTWFYTAPEAFPRFVDDRASSSRGRVSRSSDYYSLGITLIELLLGTTSLHLCQLPDLFDFYLQGGRVEIPQGIHGRLSTLLRGLLIRNRHTRWGADELARWLANDNSEDDLRRIRDDEYFEFARASRPYRLHDHSAVDLPGLAEAMFREQEIGTEDLITGDVLLNWIGALNPLTAREIKRDRDKLYMTPLLVLHLAIMRCDPTRPFIFPNDSEVNTPQEWVAQAITMLKDQKSSAESFCTPELLYQLEAWLRLKMHPEPGLADRVHKIHQSPPRVQLEELAYLFQPERPYAIMRGLVAHTPKDLVQISYGAADDWRKKLRPPYYEASYQRWLDGALCAWLRQRGLEDLAGQCDKVREELGEETVAAFETVLRLLDPSLQPIQLELDLSEVAHMRPIPYGRQSSFRIPYAARGCGVPFGAVFVSSDTPGVAMTDHLIRQREGTLEITLDTKQGQHTARSYSVTLLTEGGIIALRNSPARFSYRLEFPREMMAIRLLTGAGIGAALFGIPRLIAALCGAWRPLTIYDIDLNETWDATVQSQFPHLAYVIGLIVFLAGLYYGIRIWIRAIRESHI